MSLEFHRNSNWALSAFDRHRRRIIDNGFRTYLPELVVAIQDAWAANGCYAPLTFWSRLPDSLDYWEPTFDKTVAHDIAIVGSAEHLRELGCSERLSVYEAWSRDKTDGGTSSCRQEVLQIMHHTRDSYRLLLFEIREGRRTKYLKKRHEEDATGEECLRSLSASRPSLNPWATLDDLIRWHGIKDADGLRRYYASAQDMLRRSVR
jgi:hypothetical protein